MKIAIFSDIHGNYQSLESIIKDIKNKEYDDVICLGDIIGLGPSSNECLKLINDSNIRLILGNHELYYKHMFKLKERDIEHDLWVHSKIKESINGVEKYELNINNFKILFTHYFYKDPHHFEDFHLFEKDNYKEVLDKLNYDYVFYGHLHEYRKDVINNKTYYCLDSSGCVKDNKTFYYVINIDKDIKLEKIDLIYDRDSFIKDIEKNNYPEREEIALKFYGLKIKDVSNKLI